MKKFLRLLHTASFFKKLLISYILMLALLTGTLLFLSVNLTGTISNYSSQHAHNEALSYQSALERNLDSLQSLARELSIDQSINTLLACGGEFPPQLHYDLPSIIDKLDSYKFLSSYINTIFIYLPQQQLIVTDTSVYDPAVWNDYLLGDDRFLSYLDEYHSGARIILGGTERYAQDTAILYTLPFGASDDVQGTLAFIVDPMLVSSFKDSSSLSTDSQVFTLDEGGHILFSSIPAQTLREEYGVDPAAISSGIQTVGEYTLCAVSSASYPLIHVSMIPTLEFAHALSASRTVSAACLCALLIGGIVLSVGLANYNYRPIQQLANKASPPAAPEESALQRIERSIDELMDIRNNSADFIRENRRLHLDGLLSKLIHGEIVSASLAQDYMKKFDLHLCSPYVQLIRLCSDDEALLHPLVPLLRRHCGTSDGTEWHLISGRHDIKLFYFGATPHPSLAWVEQELQEHAPDLITAVSEVHSGLTQLAIAYEETQKIADHMRFLGKRGIMYFSELDRISVSNDRSLIFEMWFKKFSNFLTDQNLDAARSIQRQIFDELKSNNYSLQFIKCKIFSFVDHTISVIGEMDASYKNNLWEDLSLSDRLMNCTSIEQLEAEYYMIFQQLSECLMDTSAHGSIVDRIRTLTQEHYLDPMFSVSFVSEQLNVSSSYISKTFKKGTGRNLLDYVQQLRIDHAKELLRQTDLTVSAIATQSGFCNDVSFIRVFKKLEGVTPGKYRIHPGNL